jgi:hypothetical protein
LRTVAPLREIPLPLFSFHSLIASIGQSIAVCVETCVLHLLPKSKTHMKPIFKATLLIIAMVSCLATSAQNPKKSEADKKFELRIGVQFTKTISQVNKIEKYSPVEIKKIAEQKREDDLSTDKLRSILVEVENVKEVIIAKQKQYIPRSSNKHPIDKELLGILAGMPEPIASLPDAKKAMKGRHDETIFATYVKKLEVLEAQMKEAARRSIPDNLKDPEAAKAAALKNAAKAQESLDNNAMIREMGGMENLKNMTPAQREALAKQMAAKVKQNPMAYVGNDNDPAMAFTKKMMTDPSYAARFNGMNDAMKKEEYEAFKKENGLVEKTTQADRDKILAERDRNLIVMEIEKRLMHLQEHLAELGKIVSDAKDKTESYFNYVNEKISKEYGARIEALPLVEMGEYGRDKETYPVDMSFQMIVYQINAQNAMANKQVWKRYVDMLKVVIAEYNEFFAEFSGRDKVTDEILEQKLLFPAAISAGLVGEMIHYTKMAAALTSQHAGWQRVYDEQVLGVNE